MDGKSHWLSELGIFKVCPLGRVFKVGLLDMKSKPFFPQGEAQSSLSIVWLSFRGKVYGKSLSKTFPLISM